MNRIKKYSKVVFVHQNVSELLAKENGDHGKLSFKQMLDEMTVLAAKEERCENKYKGSKMHDEDVFHFPSLWKGDPPMAPVNPGYSDKASVLKSHILRTSSHHSMSSFLIHLSDVWNAILLEDFVFSFKNTLEDAAYSLLEKTLSQWKWKLQNEVLVWEQRTEYLIETCDCNEAAQKALMSINRYLGLIKKFLVYFNSPKIT